MTSPAQNATAVQGQNLAHCGFDSFEIGLLSCLRHFLTSLSDPESQAWQTAYLTAAERWGETIGFGAAQAILKVVRATLDIRTAGLIFNDPLEIDARDYVTEDEYMLIAMLHHMRRDNTTKARTAVDALTHGRMDPYVIRAGLSLARRFPHGQSGQMPARRPLLRVVR